MAGDCQKGNLMGFDGKIITISAFEDFRGYLSVIYDNSLPFSFKVKQINQGYSKKKNTLRGLHFQKAPYEQAKLVTCLHGSIFNVALDIRPESESFGHAYGEVLSFENRKMMYIPRGYAHGYLTLENDTLMQWCVDNEFNGESACAVRFDDQDIVWECDFPWDEDKDEYEYIISNKDRNAKWLNEIF